MFGFGSKATKAGLQEHKRVVAGGMHFTIKKLVPLVDFQPDRMPLIFSETTRLPKQDLSSPGVLKRLREDMMMVIQAGVVDPEIVPPGKPGITAEDIMRDTDVGIKIYAAIMEHSLIKTRGLRKPFFFLMRRLLQFTIWLRSMVKGRAISPLKENVLA